jgi:hypothetical protein
VLQNFTRHKTSEAASAAKKPRTKEFAATQAAAKPRSKFHPPNQNVQTITTAGAMATQMIFSALMIGSFEWTM